MRALEAAMTGAAEELALEALLAMRADDVGPLGERLAHERERSKGRSRFRLGSDASHVGRSRGSGSRSGQSDGSHRAFIWRPYGGRSEDGDA